MSDRIMSDFEKEVRKTLIDRNMSISDLANALGVTPAYIYDILAGNRVATDMTERIVSYLDIKVD